MFYVDFILYYGCLELFHQIMSTRCIGYRLLSYKMTFSPFELFSGAYRFRNRPAQKDKSRQTVYPYFSYKKMNSCIVACHFLNVHSTEINGSEISSYIFHGKVCSYLTVSLLKSLCYRSVSCLQKKRLLRKGVRGLLGYLMPVGGYFSFFSLRLSTLSAIKSVINNSR